MTINKLKILFKLKEENIKISNDELDEVIAFYDYLFRLIGDMSHIGHLDRFDFFDNKYSKNYFTIFKYIIFFHRHDLIKYIDYIAIDNCNISFANNALLTIIHLFKRIKAVYDEYQDDFIYGYYIHDPNSIEIYLYGIYESKIKSEIVSDNYKKVIYKLVDIFHSVESKNYYEEAYLDSPTSLRDKLYFYSSAIYFYMLGNNILVNDYERAYQFLDYINKDISGTLNKLIIAGIKNDDFSSHNIDDIKVLFDYIDHAYKNFDKEEIFRIIK